MLSGKELFLADLFSHCIEVGLSDGDSVRALCGEQQWWQQIILAALTQWQCGLFLEMPVSMGTMASTAGATV